VRDRYYISFNAGVAYSEFWPTNTPKITYLKQPGEMFMRPFIDKFKIGRLKNTTVYDIIAADFYDKTKFATEYWYRIDINNSIVPKFQFIGPVTDGKLNNQNNVYETIPQPRDNYKPILDYYERKYTCNGGYIFGERSSLLHLPTPENTNFANVDFTTLTDTGDNGYFWLHNGGGTQKGRHTLPGTMSTGDYVVITISNFTGNDIKFHIVNNAFAEISNVQTVDKNGKYDFHQNAISGGTCYLEMYDTVGGGTMGTLTIDMATYESFATSGNSLYACLNAVINGASYINAAVGVPVSTYLWNNALPTGHAVNTPNVSTYYTANPTNDYVIEDYQNWNGLWLALNDSFTTDNSSQEYSLKDVMDILKIKLRAWWFIDADGKFRIEHEKYFRDFIVQTDLTSATYTGDKPEVDSRLYNYVKGDIYNQLNYSENNENTEDWIADPVLFSAILTSKNVKSIGTPYLTTDYDYVIANPGDATSTGFMLLKTTIHGGTEYLIDIDRSSVTLTAEHTNARLGWHYLFANYWDYFAEAEDGFVNDGAHTFIHVKEFLKQDNIRFRMTGDLDWKKPFTLLNGTGWLEEAEYIMETGVYNINVGFNPYA